MSRRDSLLIPSRLVVLLPCRFAGSFFSLLFVHFRLGFVFFYVCCVFFVCLCLSFVFVFVSFFLWLPLCAVRIMFLCIFSFDLCFVFRISFFYASVVSIFVCVFFIPWLVRRRVHGRGLDTEGVGTPRVPQRAGARRHDLCRARGLSEAPGVHAGENRDLTHTVLKPLSLSRGLLS